MFWYDKDQERVMQHKKREVIRELEETKNRILKELSGVDKVTLTRLREVLADYNRIDHAINEKIKNFMSNGNVILEGAEEVAELFTEEIKKLNQLENDLENLTQCVTPQMYGAIGDGEHDDTEAIQKALNSGKVVYFPKGTYNISTPLQFNNGEIILDHETIIKAIAEMESMFIFYDTPDRTEFFTRKLKFTGGTLDADFKAKRCISSGNLWGAYFDNIQLLNIITGIDNTYPYNEGSNAEAVFSNIRIQNPVKAEFDRESTGIILRADHTAENIFMVNVSHPFKIEGGHNLLRNIHVWLHPNSVLFERSVPFELKSGGNTIESCYIDTYKTIANLTGGTNMFSSLKFLLSKEIYYENNCLFTGGGSVTIEGCMVQSNSNIKFSEHLTNVKALTGFSSTKNNCLPHNPIITGSSYNIMGANLITSLEGLDSGLYMSGDTPVMYAPSTDNTYMVFEVKRLTDYGDYYIKAFSQNGTNKGYYMLCGKLKTTAWRFVEFDGDPIESLKPTE